MHPDEVTVQQMKEALDNRQLGVRVIDVREPGEYEIARVDGVPLLPLSQLARRYTELDPEQPYFIHCKMGGRSLQAVEFLRQHGFKHVKSVRGGITAWSREIDATVPTY
jgi:adenylyltransferase/sulfurtransferase